jgi:hypothetical protein
MAECGFCGHPGVHAQVLPSRGAASGRCPSCLYCQRETEAEASKAAETSEAQRSDRSTPSDE